MSRHRDHLEDAFTHVRRAFENQGRELTDLEVRFDALRAKATQRAAYGEEQQDTINKQADKIDELHTELDAARNTPARLPDLVRVEAAFDDALEQAHAGAVNNSTGVILRTLTNRMRAAFKAAEHG